MAKKIGIIGGGQLGLMIAEEAHRQGALVYALDPAPDAPAFAECDGHIVAAYDDLNALEQLGDMTDVLTYEFENVPGGEIQYPTRHCAAFRLPGPASRKEQCEAPRTPCAGLCAAPCMLFR